MHRISVKCDIMSEKTIASFQGYGHRLQMVQYDDGTYEMRDNRKVISRPSTEYNMQHDFHDRVYEIISHTKLYM